jgi:16S rRNA (cytosine1402-N4)-methyltransferase
MAHYPVLLQEVLQYANADGGTKFIDATVGGGGHARAILKQNLKAKVLGLDWDSESLERLQEQFKKETLSARAPLIHSNYIGIRKAAEDNGFAPANGIILDLGFSSLQLDDLQRGFSFQNSGALDMRYNRGQTLDATTVLNQYPEKQLAEVFKKYGEDIHARKIAHAIVVQREDSGISSVEQVLGLIKQALPAPVKHKAADSARRIFQAIRIEVNQELDNLQKALPEMFNLLAPKGRLVVISFHSLEDRIVKNFFLELAKGCICPPDFPECICGNKPKAKILTKKPVTAGPEELAENSRSKPAKLRAIEKI